MNTCIINLAHILLSLHIRITGMRTMVSRLQVEEEGGRVPSPGTTTGDAGSGEGLAIGQPGTRMGSSQLIVGGKITERLMVAVSSS